MTARTARLLLVAVSLVLICSPCAGAQPWAKVTIERDVEYGRAGDRPLVLDIVRPKQPAKGPLPVICFIHGFGGPQVAERITAFFDKHLRGRDVAVSGEPIRPGKPPKKEK